MLHTSQNLVSHKGGEDEPGLVTRKIVHEFWQMALSEVLAVLRNNCVSWCVRVCVCVCVCVCVYVCINFVCDIV